MPIVVGRRAETPSSGRINSLYARSNQQQDTEVFDALKPDRTMRESTPDSVIGFELRSPRWNQNAAARTILTYLEQPDAGGHDRRRTPPSPWPLFDLVLRTPRLESRPPTDTDLMELVAVVRSGIHDPSWMPFLVPWTDLPSPELERSFLRIGHVGHPG